MAPPPAFQDLDIELEARPGIFEAFGADAEGHLGVSELVYLGGDAGGMLGGTGNVMGLKNGCFIWVFHGFSRCLFVNVALISDWRV